MRGVGSSRFLEKSVDIPRLATVFQTALSEGSISY